MYKDVCSLCEEYPSRIAGFARRKDCCRNYVFLPEVRLSRHGGSGWGSRTVDLWTERIHLPPSQPLPANFQGYGADDSIGFGTNAECTCCGT